MNRVELAKRLFLSWHTLDGTAKSAVCGALHCTAVDLREVIAALIEDDIDFVDWVLMMKEDAQSDSEYMIIVRIERRDLPGLVAMAPVNASFSVKDSDTVEHLKLQIAALIKCTPDKVKLSKVPLHVNSTLLGSLDLRTKEFLAVKIKPSRSTAATPVPLPPAYAPTVVATHATAPWPA